MTRPSPSVLAVLLLLGVTSWPFAVTAATDQTGNTQPHNKMIMGCWADADKGDSADLKLAFLHDGSLVQYDENQTEERRRTFGAWEMAPESSYIVVYWPSGGITRYVVKRIGPILHFSGLFGVASFTLREMEPGNCWEPKE